LADILNHATGLADASAGLAGRAAGSRTDVGFWPVDKVILAYQTFTLLLVLGWWNRLPEAPFFTAVHVAAVALLLFEVKRPNPTSWYFRNWYPLPYVGACYKEMAKLIPAVRGSNADQALANLDFRFWHANPCVWLERIQSPALTEFLQLAYTLFLPAVLLLAAEIWRRRNYKGFQYYAFLIAMGFLTSYMGYLLVPARGPRFLLASLQHVPLRGLWLFSGMQGGLDRLESVAFDCFPSGHTELTILACWGSRMVSKRLFRIYLAYTPALIFATVYLRYHYSVDLLAGAALASILILGAPHFYRKLSQRGVTIGSH
jgi:membrane-associated phospholipid phosphatase